MIINPQKYRIAFVFNTLYYPFTYPEILDSLVARGYARLVPPQPLQSGARIYITGVGVAVKATIPNKPPCFIEVNEPKKIIACDGTSIDNILASATDIVKLSREDFNLNLPDDINFVELSGSATILNGNSIDSIKEFCGDRYRVFSEILGKETSGGLIRIIPKIGVQTDKSWFDISISQKIPSGPNAYYAEFAFRNGNNIESVLEFTSNLEEKLSAIIDKIGSA